VFSLFPIDWLCFRTTINQRTHDPDIFSTAIRATHPYTTATVLSPAQTLVPVMTSTSSLDKAFFVSENYPDNSILKPGEAFTKTWEIKILALLHGPRIIIWC